MRVGINLPIEQLVATMQANSRRLPDAAARALNATAQEVQQALKAEMRRVFYQPVPYVLNSTTIVWARRERLQAEVTFRERTGNLRGGSPEQMIGTQVNGGPRAQKRSELRLQDLRPGGGALYMMPARFAQYDGYGNPSRGELTRILSQLGVLLRGDNRAARRGKRRRRSKPVTEYFAVFAMGEEMDLSGNALAPGIYRRNAYGRPLPVYFFMKRRPQYKRRLDWHGIARQTIQARLGPNFEAAMARALR
jgi:hypothetical protein